MFKTKLIRHKDKDEKCLSTYLNMKNGDKRGEWLEEANRFYNGGAGHDDLHNDIPKQQSTHLVVLGKNVAASLHPSTPSFVRITNNMIN